jgi:hypothetical protein
MHGGTIEGVNCRAGRYAPVSGWLTCIGLELMRFRRLALHPYSVSTAHTVPPPPRWHLSAEGGRLFAMAGAFWAAPLHGPGFV